MGQRPAGTALRTGEAAHAPGEVHPDPALLVHGQGLFRTGPDALPTVQTFSLIIDNLHPLHLGLRVGAPPAAKGTPLQKHSGPDPGSVMDGKLLYIKNDTGPLHGLLLLTLRRMRRAFPDSGILSQILMIVNSKITNEKYFLHFQKFLLTGRGKCGILRVSTNRRKDDRRQPWKTRRISVP